jgi:HK97 family phage major capsid protein
VALSLLDDLRQRRTEARAATDELITTAASESRDLSADELATYQARTADLREIDDEVERRFSDEVRELRAINTRAVAPMQYRGGQALASELRALSGSGSTNGGAFTPAEFANFFFDKLAATSVGLRSGFSVIRTNRDSLVVPRWTADTTAAWVTEGSAISSTDATADQITATPRKLAGLQVLSNESIADSNPALLDVAANGLVRSVGLKLDLGFYEGSGTAPEIRGLKNVASIGSVSMGTNGAAPASLDEIADAIGVLEAADAEAGAIVMHPRSWKEYSKLKELTSGSNKPLLQDSAGSGSQGVTRSIYGVPVYLTSQLSITETQGTASTGSSVYVYDPSQVYAVIREDVRVELDPYRLFNFDQSEVRAVTRADIVVPNPASVVRIAGLL